jgi:hypothetical protein
MLNAEGHNAIPSGSCLSWNNTKDRKKRVIGTMSPESTGGKKKTSLFQGHPVDSAHTLATDS